MKNIISISILLTFLICACSGLHYTADTVKFTKVYDIEGHSKNEIYNKTIKWIALNTNWSKSAIDYQDSVQGTVIVKANIITFNGLDDVIIKNTFQYDMKDNKLRITIFNNSYNIEFDKDDRNNFIILLKGLSDDLAEYVKNNDNF